MCKFIKSSFDMESILRADPHLYEVWKQRPFIFDLDAYGDFRVKFIDPLTDGEEIPEWEGEKSKMIKVYRFEDAPDEYKKLSTNGGDEDWVAFIPTEMRDEYIAWMEEGTPFGCCCVDEYPVNEGVIRIGSHS